MEFLDEVFELFTRERRRLALYYLEDKDGPVPVEELAAAVTEWESDTDRPSVPDDSYRDVEITLKHKDLPKASSAEYVEYDPEANEIELTGSPAEFQVILSVAEAIERPGDEGSLSALR